jgi:hypothetical protein
MLGSLSEVVVSDGWLLEVPVGLRPSPATVLAMSVALAAALPFSRTGRLILYPFSLLRTWVHELGHAIGAYLVGGRVKEITLHANLMGFAHSICPPERLARADYRYASVASRFWMSRGWEGDRGGRRRLPGPPRRKKSPGGPAS